MPSALKGVNWSEVRNHYLLNPSMSSRDVADHFQLSHPTVAKRCMREGWKTERDTIEQNRATVVSRVSQAVVDRVSNKAADAISSHLTSVLTSGNGILAKLQQRLESALLPDISRLDHLESATRVYRSWDDLIRRAHGLSDPTNKVDITSGGLPMHEKALALLESCTKLVQSGKVDAMSIDVDGLVREMEQDKLGDASTIGDAVAVKPVQEPEQVKTGEALPDAGSPSDTRSI